MCGSGRSTNKRAEARALGILRRLDGTWSCSGCGRPHIGLPHLSVLAPDHWPGEKSYEPNSNLRFDGDFLSEDFCIIAGQHFFVRGVASLPITGLEQPLAFGTWSTLSRANFEQYVATFRSGRAAADQPAFGWFSNRLATFDDTLNTPCKVHFRPDSERPSFELVDSGTDFERDQKEGISAVRVLSILDAYGHAPARE